MADAATTAQPAAPAGGVVTMYDRKGQAVEVPEAQAADAYRSGDLGFAEGQVVHLRRGRDVVALDGAQAGALLDSREGRFYDAGDAQAFAEQEEARELGGFGGQAKAFGAGLARSLTFGGSDWLASEYGGDEARRELSGLRRVNPNASLLGEVTGMVAPALVSGGSLAGLRAATAVPRGLAAAAGLGERAAMRGLVAAGAAEGGLLARAGGAAVRGAVEMGAYGAGQEVSRAALANERLNGEKLYAAFVHDAMIGGGLGVGAAALGALGGKALDAAGSAAERFAGKAAGEVAPTVGGKVRRIADAALPGGVEGFAAEKALESTGASARTLEELRVLGPEGKAAVVRQVEQLPTFVGKEPGTILSRPQMAEAAEAAANAYNRQAGDALAALDGVGAKIKPPDLAAVAKEARATLLSSLEALPGRGKDAAWLRGYLDDLDRLSPGANFTRAHELASDLGLQLRRARVGAPLTEAQGSLQSLLEREITRSAEAAGRELGVDVAATLKAAREQQATALWVERATREGVATEAGGGGLRGLFSAEGSSSTGRSAGSAAGSAVGSVLGPAGAAAGGAVGSVAGSVAGAYLDGLRRRYGAQIVSKAARMLGEGAGPAQIAAAVIEDVMGKSAGAFVRKGAEVGAKVAGQLPHVAAEVAQGVSEPRERGRLKRDLEGRGEAKREAEYLAARARAAEVVAQANRGQRITAALPPGTPPDAAKAAQATGERVAAYLKSKMPAEPSPGSSLAASLAAKRPPVLPDATEQQKFLAAVQAIDDPATLLRQLEAGNVNPITAETVRAVFPEYFANISTHLEAAVRAHPGELTYQQEIVISQTFGIVTHPSTDPGFLARQQAMYAEAHAQMAQAAPPRRSSGPSRVARLYDPDAKDIG